LKQLEANYGIDQIVHVEWHVSQAFNNPDAEIMQAYYGVSASPTVLFDGLNRVVGGGTDMYPIYEPRFLADRAAQSKLIMDAHVYFPDGGPTGSVTVDLEVAPGEVIGAEHTLKVIIYEDNLFFGASLWQKIGRSIALQTPMTIANGGETQTVTHGIPMDPFSQGWNPQNCRAIAYVQRDSNFMIIQSQLCRWTYDVEVTDLESAVTSVETGQADEIDTQVEYTGAVNDDVVITLDKSTLPAGWDAEIVWNAGTYPTGLTITNMSPGQIEPYQVRIIPSATPGAGNVSVSTEPISDPLRKEEHTYYMFAGTPAILFVDDDRGASTESTFEQAVLDAGYFSITHDFSAAGSPTAAIMESFDVVIWTTGELQTGTLGNVAEGNLGLYLDAGGSLFLTSQGFLNHRGANSFAQTYLGVSSFLQDQQAPSATGVASDPIGDGLNLTLSPPFPDLADEITGTTGGAVSWLDGTSNPIGVRLDTGGHKTVFMSAAFDGISTVAPDPNNQAIVMQRIIQWLLPTATDVRPTAGPAPVSLALAQNTPNPFRGVTSLRFAVPSEGPVSLAVYNIAGRKVADLVNKPLDAGAYTVSWDGLDRSGSRVASGVYLYRLSASGQSLSKEMVFVR
jgi:hypothetical protein